MPKKPQSKMERQIEAIAIQVTHLTNSSDKSEKRFAQIEKRFDQADKRFDQLEAKIDKVLERTDQFISLHAGLSKRVDRIEARPENRGNA